MQQTKYNSKRGGDAHGKNVDIEVYLQREMGKDVISCRFDTIWYVHLHALLHGIGRPERRF